MPLLSRPDGDVVREASAMRRLMPHLMKTRNESVVYFEQVLDVTGTLEYLSRVNAGLAEGQARRTLFQIVLCAAARTLGARPELNQFVSGRRLYRRKAIELSFAVKKAMRDDAAMTMVKVTFEPGDTLDDVARRVEAAIGVGRGSERTASEKEMGLVARLPRDLVRLLVSLQRLLDYYNLLPASMIRPDPLYASMVLANVGSVGIDSAYHHLYEYGTATMFAVVGRVHKGPRATDDGQLVVRDLLSIKYSLDERAADAFYCARSLELFRDLVESPAALERSPTE